MSLIAQVTTYPFGVSDPAPIQLLESAGITVRLSPHGRKHRSEETAALLGDVDILIAGTETLDGAVLSRGLPRLKHVAKVGVGLDGLDIGWCADHGVAVSYTPDAPARSVVEQVFAVLISLSRGFVAAHEGLRQGRWQRITGMLWEGKTLGIIGAGRIGRQVADLARAYRMRVLATDIVEDPAWAATAGVTYCGLEALLAESDAVTLHVPLTRLTRRLMNRERLAQMRRGAYLVNTCRGPVVEEAALIEALRSGHLAGAAIDVYEHEPYSGPLSDLPNVFLTCHQGSCSFDGRFAMEHGAAENAVRYLRGEALDPARTVWLPGMPKPELE